MFCIDPATAAASQANKEEADARSVFVGNVSTRMLKSLSALPSSRLQFIVIVSNKTTCYMFLPNSFIFNLLLFP